MYRWLYLSPSDNSRKKLKFLSKVRSSKQIWGFIDRKCCSTRYFKGFFRSLAKKYLYVVICNSDGTYNHLIYFEKKSNYEEQITRNGARIRFYNPSTTCLRRFFVRNIVEWGNSSQIDFVVTCTADCTGHHPTIRERNWNFWVSREVLNKYGDLSIANVARLGSLKAFFRSLAKKYLYVVICHSDGTYNHLTYFEKNPSMRSEPQKMVFDFDFITLHLTCLCRYCERNIVKWGTENLAKLTSWWHVPLIVLVTIRQFAKEIEISG